MAVFLAIGLLLGRGAFGATELIGNGDFESASSSPWIFGGDLTSVPIVSNPALAFGGNNFLSIGNVNGVTNQQVYQTVTIPANCLLALYTYYFDATSVSPGDPANSVQFDSLVVYNGNSTILDEEFNSSFGYQKATFNLTSFAGKTVQIGFLIQQLQLGFGVRSSWGFDNVSLLSFTTNDIPPNDYFTNSISLGMATSVTVTATNVLATREPGEPKITGNSGGHSLWWNWTAPSNGVVTIDTSGSTFDTLLGVYTGDSVSSLTQVAANDDAAGRGDGTSQVKFSVVTGTQYQIAVDGKSGATGGIQLSVSFLPDTKAPTVSITSPKSGAKLTNSTVVVQGKATDNLAVAFVQFRLENADGTNDYQNADGTNTWSATVTGLIPGPNTIRVRAFDTSGNQSTTAAITVTYAVVSPIAVSVGTGSGTISPNLDGQLLDVGSTFTITAKPAAGQVFSNWTGSIIATTAKLTFTMQSNMVLQANFTPNPFIPLAGIYQGLLYSDTVAQQSSGFFNATVTSSGSFSAKLVLGGVNCSLSGIFSAGGFASNNIVRKGLPPVSAQLHLDMSGGGITGEFSDGTWTAELNAARAASSPVAQAGHYTLLIPGGADGVNQPGGDSYGTIIVGPTGTITFKGVLADGTKVTQKANLLSTGQWAFYIPLYSGHGSILGWLTFNDQVNSDITGMVDWFKPVLSPGKLYPGGFTNSTEAAGSSYEFTSGTPVLNFQAGEVWLANGNLSSAFTNQVTLNSLSKVTNQSTNALTLTITTSTGLFKGSVVNPATGGKAIPFTGVILQKQNFGGGFFTGTDQTGRAFFGPQSP